MIRFAIVAAVALSAMPAAASAEDAATTLRRFGLPGVYSKDCAQPASFANPHTRYEAQGDGTVRLVYDAGGSQSGYVVNSARILSPAIIAMEEVSDGGLPFQVVLTLDGKRIRVIESRDPRSGRAYISGGVLVANGRETGWEFRCR